MNIECGVMFCVFSLQQRDEKVRTVETLLESSLIQVANKEDELKVNEEICSYIKVIFTA